MRKISSIACVVFVFLAFFLSRSAFCFDSSFSDFGDYGTTKEDRLRYNPFENEWSYEPEDARLKYNPFENRWEWAH
jgi:hypothetical protein